MDLLILLIILIFSAIVHEVSHGLAAERFGDDTARQQGRITLNPVPHIDPYGSILLPALLLFIHSPVVFGAAKPVPVNFNNLHPRRLGMAAVSLAGPASNFLLAVLGALVMKLGLSNSVADPILTQFILINIVLGTFNLIPIPPLDGSKIIAALLPEDLMISILSWGQYGLLLLVLFLLVGRDWLGRILVPIVNLFARVFSINFNL